MDPSLFIQNMQTEKKEIHSLYALKAFCAIAVVLIHTDFYGKTYFIPLTRLAVPLFYMISGYFLFAHGAPSGAKLRRTLWHILGITVLSTLVYLAYNYANSWLFAHEHHRTVSYMRLFFPRDFWPMLLLANPYNGVLWYLTAYMQALLLLWLCVRFRLTDACIRLLPLFFAVTLLLGCYFPFEKLPLYVYRNFFTMAFPFLLLGAWVRRSEATLVRWSRGVLPVLLFVLLAATEYVLLKAWGHLSYGDCMISTIYGALLFFVLCLSRSTAFRGTFWSYLGRYCSLNIYLYHILMMNFWRHFCTATGFHHPSQLLFPIVLALTILFSLFWAWINTKRAASH